MSGETSRTMGATARLPMSRSQMLVCVVMGVILWFLAAMLLRTLAPMGVYDGWNRVLLYALTVPGTVPFVWLMMRVARLRRDQIALGVAAGTAAATLCDGIALAWFPQLYGDDLASIAGAGAAILWGAGVGLVLGFIANRVS